MKSMMTLRHIMEGLVMSGIVRAMESIGWVNIDIGNVPMLVNCGTGI